MFFGYRRGQLIKMLLGVAHVARELFAKEFPNDSMSLAYYKIRMGVRGAPSVSAPAAEYLRRIPDRIYVKRPGRSPMPYGNDILRF
jgi:hypothetical protein